MKKNKIFISFFLISFSLFSNDLEFFNKMIDTQQYDLSRNYGKGCEIFSNKDINFSKSKRLLKTLYLVHYPVDYYCSCPFFISQNNQITIDQKSCGYKPKSKEVKISINWEHIMPAHRFGHQLECWNKEICQREVNGEIKTFKGRKCCEKVDKCFNIREGDIHNLVPSVFELNLERQNYFFGEIPGEERYYGNCNFEVDKKNKIAEPPDNISGDFARAYLYMAWMYQISLTQEEMDWLKKWNEIDPPDENERKINSLKASIQGNENPFITYYKINKN